MTINRPYAYALLLTLLIVGLIVLYVFEFPYINRTLHGGRLVLGALLTGAILGGFLGYRYRHQAADLTEQVQLYLFFMVLTALFMPLFASLSNRLLSWQPVQQVTVEFVEEDSRFVSLYGLTKDEQMRPNRYYLFFYYQGELFRIQTNTPLATGLEQGDALQLPLKKGLWGFEVAQPEKTDEQRN